MGVCGCTIAFTNTLVGVASPAPLVTVAGPELTNDKEEKKPKSFLETKKEIEADIATTIEDAAVRGSFAREQLFLRELYAGRAYTRAHESTLD